MSSTPLDRHRIILELDCENERAAWFELGKLCMFFDEHGYSTEIHDQLPCIRWNSQLPPIRSRIVRLEPPTD